MGEGNYLWGGLEEFGGGEDAFGNEHGEEIVVLGFVGVFEVAVVGVFAVFENEGWHDAILHGLCKHDEATGASVAVAEGVDEFEDGVGFGEALDNVFGRGIHIVY